MRGVLISRSAQAVILGVCCLLGVFSQRSDAATGDISTAVGTGALGVLDRPAGVACDALGNLFVCDINNNRLIKIDVATGVQTNELISLTYPTGLLVDKTGNIYLSNTSANTVLKFDALTGVWSTYAGNGGGSTTGDGGSATAAGVPVPGGLAMDIQGNLYISQISGTPSDNRIRRVDVLGRITTFAGGGGALVTDGAKALDVQLTIGGSNGIFVDLADNVYVADLTHILYRINSTGILKIIAGTGTAGYTGDGGLATLAQVDTPTNIAVDVFGNVFFDNAATVGRVRKIDAATGIISTLAGTAVTGFSGDGGPGVSAQVDMGAEQGGMCLDKFGNVFFSDVHNNRVRKLATVGYGTPPSGPLLTYVAPGSVGTAFTFTLPKTPPYVQTPATYAPGLTLTGSVVSGVPTATGVYPVDFRTGSLSFRVYFFISPAGTGLNGGGPTPIPRFVTIPAGGTAPADVILNPFDSYLPISTIASQRYLYQTKWDYGDGITYESAVSSTPATVLIPVLHVYGTAGLFTIRMTIATTIEIIDPTTGLPVVPAQVFAGPTTYVEKVVKVSNTNYQPGPIGFNTGSPIEGDGTLPYNAQVTPSFAQDVDGYLIWAAIDWGDGTAEIIPNPPTLPAVPNNHIYTTPGLYKVIVSVIDNGRIPLGTIPPLVPLPNDAQAALQYFINYQKTLPLTSFDLKFFALLINPGSPTSMDKRFDPQLRQDFILIQVPGNMNGLKGKFQLDFAKSGRDSFDQQVRFNTSLNAAASLPTVVTLGTGATAVVKTFTTDTKGRYKDATGFSFSFDNKKKIGTVRFTKIPLTTVLGLTNATVVNSTVDVPLTIVFDGSTTLSTVVRYAYNATAGKKGLGKGGLSKAFGN